MINVWWLIASLGLNLLMLVVMLKLYSFSKQEMKHIKVLQKSADFLDDLES